VPLASRELGCFVAIDFLLLRPEREGVLLNHSGDVRQPDQDILTRFSLEADRLLDPAEDSDAVIVARVVIRSSGRASGNPYALM